MVWQTSLLNSMAGQTQKFGSFTTNINDIIDDDTMATASATSLATSESIKAYVDANSGGEYDATVGTGGDYADVQAAITGVGGTDIRLLFVSGVTEDSNIAVGGLNLLINLSNFTLTMGANQFTYASAADVTIRGNGIGSGAEIDWTHTSAGTQLFENASFTTSTTTISGIVLDNNSSTNDTYVSTAIEFIDNVELQLPNQVRSGILGQGTGNTYSNIRVIGGGASSSQAFQCVSGVVTNLYVAGTFDTGIGIRIGSNSTASGIVTNHITNPMELSIDTGATVSNVLNMSAQALLVTLVNGSGANLSNMNLGSGGLDIQGFDNGRFSNIIGTGTLDLTDAGAVNNCFTNCRFTSAFTLAGDRNKFTNCDFIGGGSVSSGADDNGFVNCQFGADAGGGSLTLTINSGSNRTRASNCLSDVVISDSGTDSALANNTVY